MQQSIIREASRPTSNGWGVGARSPLSSYTSDGVWGAGSGKVTVAQSGLEVAVSEK